ncbi:Stk1 family PASTA domain-containing Ser/Thr kinase [Microbacterium esteraromaticum]|uniref:Stk1 family PASTA domain-containing Ser/Thr kinase n=1 Tax=Microbacterium esteraromaticum TaxID=57043 RepID=UPI00309C6B25
MNTPQADPLIGRLVDGRYRVRARIARGGMATVYVATDMRLERRIALKVMHAHLSDDSAFQSRFIQEARAAARLADPHVVNVFDQGQDGELAYLVMEYLPGITLRELMREQKRLTVTQTITIMDAILSGLAAAHAAGIVHRDVKPENVLLAEDGRIKIGDFGLARATTANTATGAQLLGTIAYLAPELVTRGTADARSDIYALGIMLYEMLVGEQPYQGEQPMQIAFQHATEQVPRPSARNAGVPDQLDELVLWATAKSPDDRPMDAKEMLTRLREIEREIGVAPVPTATEASSRAYDSGSVTKILPGTAVLPAADDDAEEGADNATRLRRRTARRRSTGAALLTLVLLLAVLAGAAGWWFGSGPGSLIAVPSVAGMSYEDAAAAVEAEGLVPERAERSSIDVDQGLVIESAPGEAERVEKDSTVSLVVSTGPARHDLPALRGKSADEVRSILAANRVNVSDDVEEYFDDLEKGLVLNVRVTPRDQGEPHGCADGCQVFEDDTALLQLSLGAVPDVTGKPLDEAVRTLEDVKLEVADERPSDWSESVAKGSVIAQSSERPGGGAWRPGDTVTLTVSKGPQPLPIPDVKGKSVRDAVSTLKDAGFEVQPTIEDVEIPLGGKYWDIYKVCSYAPTDTAPRGTTITLTPGIFC